MVNGITNTGAGLRTRLPTNSSFYPKSGAKSDAAAKFSNLQQFTGAVRLATSADR